MRKTVVWIGVACVVAALSWTFRFYTPWHQAQAREKAEVYLTKKCSEPMIYERVRFSAIDPMLYYVLFHPSDDPAVSFAVIVNPKDLSLARYPDNYIEETFAFRMSQKYDILAKELWGKEAGITVSPHRAIYSFQDTSALSTSMGLADLSQGIDYSLYIRTSKKWPVEDPASETNMILRFISALTEDEITIGKIVFVYSDEEHRTDQFFDLSDKGLWNEEALCSALSSAK